MTNPSSCQEVPGVSPSPQLAWVVALTSAAYFMVVLDATAVVTALPRMQRGLHTGLEQLQWTINAYGIAFAAGIVLAAALGDRFGRRRVFVSGLALFTASSAACAVAPTIGALIAGRAVQGIGAAVVLPLSLTILTTAFPPERRGRIVGVYGGLAGLAVAAGPLVGGAVTQSLDWQWVFWLNVPIGCVAIVLAVQLLPETFGPRQRLDFIGVMSLTAGATALVWALTRGNDVGWASTEVVSCMLAGAILVLAFVAWERRCPEPMIPPRLFTVRDFAVGNVTTFLMNGATFAAALFVTEEFQLARGYSPVGAGLRLLPFFGTPMVFSPLAGALSDRIGRRPVMVTGLALQAVGYVWVAARGGLATGWGEFVAALFVAGIGISFALPTVPTAVLDSVAEAELGKASGVNYMAARFGSVLAVAIAGAVFAVDGSLGSPASVTAGFRPAIWACAGFAVLAAISALGLRDRGPAPLAEGASAVLTA